MPKRSNKQKDSANDRVLANQSAQHRSAEKRSIQVPLLPLVGNVIFPQSIYPLTLQGEQAVRLARAAQERGGLVALFLQRDLAADPPGIEDLYQVGTLARVENLTISDTGLVEFAAVGVEKVE